MRLYTGRVHALSVLFAKSVNQRTGTVRKPSLSSWTDGDLVLDRLDALDTTGDGFGLVALQAVFGKA